MPRTRGSAPNRNAVDWHRPVFDSHCHPTDIDDSFSVIRDAVIAGVCSLLACGYHRESNAEVLRLRARIPNLPIALGLHPWYASEPLEPILQQMASERPMAVGECGLDAFEDPSIPPMAVQRVAFESQLSWANDSALPVTVHSRKAAEGVYEIIRRYPKVRGVLHAYSGSYETARKFIDRGWMIGVGGAMTRPNAHRIRKVATQVPLEAMLLETDSPAIGMQDIMPPHVRPAHLGRVVAALAQLRNVPTETVIEVTTANAEGVFGSAIRRALELSQL